ncbi:MAG: hypothetical protein CM15mV143_230 [Caudoviricetes sp.]|nr:MAG: hypothetical protein CM15mV143_230 [Caudoviricetes sp.]
MFIWLSFLKKQLMNLVCTFFFLFFRYQKFLDLLYTPNDQPLYIKLSSANLLSEVLITFVAMKNQLYSPLDQIPLQENIFYNMYVMF